MWILADCVERLRAAGARRAAGNFLEARYISHGRYRSACRGGEDGVAAREQPARANASFETNYLLILQRGSGGTGRVMGSSATRLPVLILVQGLVRVLVLVLVPLPLPVRHAP